MIQISVAVALALAVLALVIWLVRSPGNAQVLKTARNKVGQAGMELMPCHYRYFPQIRQALSTADEKYLRERGFRQLAEKVRRERRAVARQFLSGLKEDFMKLDRLARIVASLSPVVSREQESERLLLGMKFRLLYAWVWLRVSAGSVSLPHLEQLTMLVGQLSSRMELAMTAINAMSAQSANQGVKA